MKSDSKGESKVESSSSRSLDFDPQSFVNVGRSWLSMQDRQAMESASTQTNSLRTRSIASATISTDSRSTDSDSEARTRIARLKYLVCILLIAVVMLLGTNALFCVQRSALKSQNAALEARAIELEALAKNARKYHEPKMSPATGSNACEAELIDTCWFKVGFGNCAKQAWVNPVGVAEGAWRSAWDSTVEFAEELSRAVVNDIHQLGKELHDLGGAVSSFLGGACSSSPGSEP